AWVGEQPVIGADDPPPLAPVGPRGLAYGGWELGRVLGDVRPIDNPKPDQAPCERPRAEPELEFGTQTPVEEVGEPFRITVGQNPTERSEILRGWPFEVRRVILRGTQRRSGPSSQAQGRREEGGACPDPVPPVTFSFLHRRLRQLAAMACHAPEDETQDVPHTRRHDR